ncbi:uncharacterized protein LOC108155564 [Drosophila miranda]|uniref:uncharacterized protein LOC108155564 n=1 Tax=Drosophila miranda TaxID=7229 RepID=UPI0007E6A10A|nr:uncharacterized protein LOC108155564 [Drosophila miranda]
MSQERKEGRSSPPYIDFFETLLVEELALEPNYLKLHYGKCAVIGRLTVVSEKYRLENVRVKSLPEECSLPEGILSVLLLGLDIAKASEQNLSSGCYCIVRGEVVLCCVQFPNSPTLTTGGVLSLLQAMGDDEAARKNYLEELHKTHIPAIDVWFAQPVESFEELIDRRLQIKQLSLHDSHSLRLDTRVARLSI